MKFEVRGNQFLSRCFLHALGSVLYLPDASVTFGFSAVALFALYPASPCKQSAAVGFKKVHLLKLGLQLTITFTVT